MIDAADPEHSGAPIRCAREAAGTDSRSPSVRVRRSRLMLFCAPERHFQLSRSTSVVWVACVLSDVDRIGGAHQCIEGLARRGWPTRSLPQSSHMTSASRCARSNRYSQSVAVVLRSSTRVVKSSSLSVSMKPRLSLAVSLQR